MHARRYRINHIVNRLCIRIKYPSQLRVRDKRILFPYPLIPNKSVRFAYKENNLRVAEYNDEDGQEDAED
jgi:hypothetical protein